MNHLLFVTLIISVFFNFSSSAKEICRGSGFFVTIEDNNLIHASNLSHNFIVKKAKITKGMNRIYMGKAIYTKNYGSRIFSLKINKSGIAKLIINMPNRAPIKKNLLCTKK